LISAQQVHLNTATPPTSMQPTAFKPHAGHNKSELTYQHSLWQKALTAAASCVTRAVLPSTKKVLLGGRLVSQMQDGKQACWQNSPNSAPNSDKLMPGRLEAYAYIVKQLLGVPG